MRTILAIIAGYVLWTVLWLGGGAAIAAAFPEAYPEGGPFNATVPLLLTLGLSIVCSFAAGIMATKLASDAARAVWIMAILLLLTGIGVQASTWSLMPVWFHIPFLVLLIPICLLGRKAVEA